MLTGLGWFLEQVPLLPVQPVSQAELRATFEKFARFGSRAGAASPSGPVDMDGAKFAKLCRECGLIEGGLTATAADLIFSKVKPKVCTATVLVVGTWHCF